MREALANGEPVCVAESVIDLRPEVTDRGEQPAAPRTAASVRVRARIRAMTRPHRDRAYRLAWGDSA
jgi:hypothetical protein